MGGPLAGVVSTIDRRFVLHAALWSGASLLAFGVVAGIIRTRSRATDSPAPFAIAVWLVSGPLMGLLGATYSAPVVPGAMAAGLMPLLDGPADGAIDRRGTTLGTVASVGAFLAIGCPVCNKIALLLLGAGGALRSSRPTSRYRGRILSCCIAGRWPGGWRARACDASRPDIPG